MMAKVHFETAGSLGVLTLANPPLNLLTGELIEDLRAAVDEARRLPLRAMLLRAEGKIFSAGADVSAFKGKTGSDARASFTAHLRMIADLEELPFPTLAAVQGMCFGGGLELALACDLIWAAASARLGQLEATIGTTTLLGGVQRLTERAGPNRAREIIYTAEQYDAATFERWNIVNRVVPDDMFESQTRAFAEKLASGPTLAYAAGKRIVRAYLEGGVRAADKVVDEVAPPLFQSEDMRAAVAALVEHGARNFRDKVVFQGR
ncbi:MAG TPA: enoyl-CoA hydratase/isomerase family protein [Candidatus Acidoferrales bacterium]|nr:enoyl-CoA hydratase/isomerase family protein [Candidatus Acidoferrales bacterium]